MGTAVDALEQMEAVLDSLIANAEKLKDLSINMETFSEEAVLPLQQKQELLVEQLNAHEKTFEGTDKDGFEMSLAKIGDRMSKKLRYFQHLNAVFVENITEGNTTQRIEDAENQIDSYFRNLKETE